MQGENAGSGDAADVPSVHQRLVAETGQRLTAHGSTSFFIFASFSRFKGINSAPDHEGFTAVSFERPRGTLEDEDLALFWRVCPGHKKLLYIVLLQCWYAPTGRFRPCVG